MRRPETPAAQAHLTNWLFTLTRAQKAAVTVTVDLVLLSVAFAIAMVLRLEDWGRAMTPESWLTFAICLPITLFVFRRLGFYRAIIRYISTTALRSMTVGVFVSAASLFVVSQSAGLFLPRSVPIIYALIAIAMIGSSRFYLRALYMQSRNGAQNPVIIYGAGEAGSALAESLGRHRSYAPVAFVDDSVELQGKAIAGVTVNAPARIPRLVEDFGVHSILLALPRVSRARRAEILASLDGLPVRVQTIPELSDIFEGRMLATDLRDVPVEDLLGRDPVPPQQELMKAKIMGKSVLVTGAGGSIGRELCHQILAQEPRRLVMVEAAEHALYEVDRSLRKAIEKKDADEVLVPLIANAGDGNRMRQFFDTYAVETVYHAAAFKHVPLLEDNIVAGLSNNVIGMLNLANAIAGTSVSDFILISSDKAVRPTNVMGASKRLAELICQAAAQREDMPRFSMVRFGNVLGSSGSVIPLFRDQIAAGGPVTVTNPEITRYFMTIREAAELVIQAGAMAKGGDVFLLNMGEPVRILDLALRMIRLSGLIPTTPEEIARSNSEGNIVVVFSGLRPGEKLHEELLVGPSADTTAHPKIMRAEEFFLEWDEILDQLRSLQAALEANDLAAIRQQLREMPLGYTGGGASEPVAAGTDTEPQLARHEASGSKD